MEVISFYQIVYKDTLLYIGSTSNLYQRIALHKHMHKYSTCDNILYDTMRKLSEDFTDFDIYQTESLECSKSERWRHERELIDTYAPSCNQKRPMVTYDEKKQEWREQAKKDYKPDKKREYYLKKKLLKS